VRVAARSARRAFRGRPRPSQPKKPALIVRLHPFLALDVHFVEGGEYQPREILEASFRVELAPRQLFDRGKLRPWKVPVGFLLTEFTSGRVAPEPNERGDVVAATRQMQSLLESMALLLLSESGEEPANAPKSLLDWHRGKPDSSARYRDALLRYYKAISPLAGLAGWQGITGDGLPFKIHEEVARLREVEVDPHGTWERWQKSGLGVTAERLPFYFYSTDSVYEAALAELWWCIEHRLTARRCRECSGWLVPSGPRWWLQHYCHLHRAEGSAARHRARLKRLKRTSAP